MKKLEKIKKKKKNEQKTKQQNKDGLSGLRKRAQENRKDRGVRKKSQNKEKEVFKQQFCLINFPMKNGTP